MNNYHYISIGSNCAPAICLKELGLKSATLPFDWIPSTPKVVLDCLTNSFEKFLTFDDSSIDDRCNELISFQIKDTPNFPSTHINKYHNWFPHDKSNTKNELIEKYNRRCIRLNDILKDKNTSLVFIFANEHGIYHNKFFKNQKIYYDSLIELTNLLKNKYELKNFTILAFFINENFPSIDNLNCYNINWNKNEMSKNLETHTEMIYSKFRNILKIEILNNLKLLNIIKN